MRTPDGDEAGGDLAEDFGGFGDGDGVDDPGLGWGTGDDPLPDPVAATYPAGDPYADDQVDGDLHGDVDVDGDGHADGMDDADRSDEARSPFVFEANDFRPGGLFGLDAD